MAPRRRDVVVVGASAGGVEALRAMASRLPADLPASVLVVLHLPMGGTSALPAILDRVGPLPAATARNGEPLEHGRIYTARPDHHLMVVDDVVHLSHGPTENGHRPAVNTLFRSAAIARGAAVTGVLLSGVLDDGVAGLHTIAQRGGRVVVQDPDDALYRGMPENALRSLTPDHVVAAREIGDVLTKITAEHAETTEQTPELVRWEHEVASVGWHVEGAEVVGVPSEFSCPDCDGVLADIESGQRYRCRVGHAWTVDGLLAAQESMLERALWTAVRSLEERAALSHRMAAFARARGSEQIAQRYEAQAGEADQAAGVIRQQVTGQGQART